MKTTIKPESLLAATQVLPFPKLAKALKGGAVLCTMIDGRLYRVVTDYREVLVDVMEKGKARVEVELWQVEEAPAAAPADQVEEQAPETSQAAPTAAPVVAPPPVPRRGPGRPWGEQDAPAPERTALSLTQKTAGAELAREMGISLSELVDRLLYQTVEAAKAAKG